MAVKVFFDASVYFSGARSPLEGSGFLLELAKRGKLRLFATRTVPIEAERNLRLKEKAEVLVRYYDNLRLGRPEIVKINQGRARQRYRVIINEKDALVLAGAEKSKVDYLVTLDRKHFFVRKLRLAKLPFKIVTPGQLIEELKD